MEEFQYKISLNHEVMRPLFLQKKWLERFLERTRNDPIEAYAAWLRWVEWYESRRPDRLCRNVLERTGRLMESVGTTENNHSVILIRTCHYSSNMQQDWIEDSMLYCFEEHLRRENNKVILVIDNKNLHLGNLHYSIPHLLRTLLDLMINNYPSMLHAMFINDMNILARTIWMAIRDFIPDRIRRKIHLTQDAKAEMLPFLGQSITDSIFS